jgi:S-methyl-5-thioribose-1-phosphate isomerase
MKVNGKDYRTIWLEDGICKMINQNLLPHKFEIFEAKTYQETCVAIKTMITRGAGAIGAAAGFAMAQAAFENPDNNAETFLTKAKIEIEATRPTAQDLFAATARVFEKSLISSEEAVKEAQKIANENVDAGRKIGEFGAELLRDGMRVLTHCNAGWLAFVDWGTAISPVYVAKEQEKSIFVYSDETRPRLQGSRLSAWELYHNDIPHKIIPDNAAAALMQDGKIDIVITGADRIAANGDTANKIGTLEKAICAKYFDIPFYIAAPSSTFDKNCPSGKEIPIEYRSDDEVKMMEGIDSTGNLNKITVANPSSEALNPGFDVTPADLITGYITENGIKNGVENL